GGGAVEILDIVIGVAAVEVGVRVPGIGRHRAGVVREGAVVVTFVHVDATAVAVRRHLWADLDGSGVIGDRAVVVLFFLVGDAAVVIGGGIARIFLDQSRATSDAAIAIAASEVA